MLKIKNEAGEEVEVFTSQELEDAKKEVEENTKKASQEEHSALSQKIEEHERNLEGLNQKLKDAEENNNGGNKDEQIERLRSKITEVVDSSKKTQEELDSIKKSGIDSVKNDFLERLSGGDKDKREKIEMEFEKYRPNDNSPDQIKERIITAHKIVTGSNAPSNIINGIPGAGGSRNIGVETQGQNGPSENEKAIGRALGVTDEMRKKFEEHKKNN